MTDYESNEALKGLSAEEFLTLLEKGTPEQLQAIASLGTQARVKGRLPAAFSKLCAAPAHHQNAWSILCWWEKRRPAYNLIVAVCGLPALAVMGLAFHAPLSFLVTGTLVYGIAANLCYLLGAPAETIAWMIWKKNASHIGPVLFTLGTIFSMFLTLGASGLMLIACLSLWAAF